MRRPQRDERGSATAFVIGMSIVLLVCAGLVVDGGLAINARMRVADDAEQAARVAADAIDVGVLRSGGGLVIDPIEAQRNASSYLVARGYATGEFQVQVQAGTVTVRVSDTTESMILGLVGVDTFDVNASATARPSTGATP